MLGIFDSGLGGLTVVREIERVMPRVGYVYLGDTARLPYGTKSPETIERYALQALRFLKRHGATTPVIACHSVSSLVAARPSARQRLARAFGARNLYEVVTPAIVEAKRASKNGRIGVLGTNATIRSRAYERALKGYCVVPVAASVLVSLAEEGWAHSTSSGRRKAVRQILQEILRPFQRERVDTVVLACTHFPLLKRPIRDILGPSVRLVDPGRELARGFFGTLRPGSKRFFATDVPQDFSERTSRFLGRPVRAQKTDLR